jgi:trimethylamine:corrinoid methyltransferase-like protein
MQMFYNRPATCDYLGSLDQGLTFSEHALVLCDDLAGLLKKMWEGLRVSPEQIGTELIRELGPRGQFLAEPHTVENCRTQVWDSRYLGANFPLSNNDLPDEDLLDRLDRDLQERLSAPPPPLPDAAVMAVAQDVLARF